MKKSIKLLACLLVSILSFATLTISACFLFGSEEEVPSDEVTEEEWTAAMSANQALNVTLNCTYQRIYLTETREIKAALTASGSYVTGKMYEYDSGDYSSYNESYSYTNTTYEVYNSNSYSYVSKETQTGENDSWDGDSTDTYTNCKENSDIYDAIVYYMCTYANRYYDFEYIDGVYKYTESDEYSFSVKINDGYVSYVYEEGVVTYYEPSSNKWSSGSYVTQNYTMAVKFSDYGSTTITIPDEFTYENYAATIS